MRIAPATQAAVLMAARRTMRVMSIVERTDSQGPFGTEYTEHQEGTIIARFTPSDGSEAMETYVRQHGNAGILATIQGPTLTIGDEVSDPGQGRVYRVIGLIDPADADGYTIARYVATRINKELPV